jgi:hypothetical protein
MRIPGVFMGKQRITVSASRHSCRGLPVSVSVGDAKKAFTGVKDVRTGRTYPAQMSDGSLCWILDEIGKGESREFEPVSQPVLAGVQLADASDGKIDFLIGGDLFTTYHFGAEIARPYLYPVIGPGGACVTRHYPMRDDIPGETKDHHHHKSVWVAHGDVNGVDDWSEETGHGRIVHREFIEKTSGPVFARIRTLNDWVGNDGHKVMEEERTITVYNLPEDGRFIDIDVIFRATDGDVKFGDTKEGGIISVRVATSIDGNKGGLITNSFGGITEGESWGKRAHWCDYSGPVEGRTVGITIFDAPSNFRYPAYWHVRDYGLMTANPFALSEYYHDKTRDGSHVIRSGENFPFTYRLFIHAGDALQANVAEMYHGYVNPPSIGNG